MFKRLQVFGTMLRVRSVAEKAAATDGLHPRRRSAARVGRGVTGHRPHPAPRRRREAYDLLAADAVFGGIVLDLT